MDATVQTYVTQLSNGEADLTFAANAYNDVLSELALLPVLTRITTVAHASGVITLAAQDVIPIIVAYGSPLLQLGKLTVREINWLDRQWRTTTAAQPLSYVQESYNTRVFQLVPIPSGAGSATIITSETLSTNLPTQLQLPVALLILYAEYKRESNHQNAMLAESFLQLGAFLMKVALT